ncbi:flagellar FliJ protein [Amphibacillus marinus]|uniref:Flagellar FliJ protein n=1 Tax=Amphibacillus marinus TaxID=872970 RepID=A0A1H8HRY5_9BACI|nr:flagellar export protein FliJ [Amphibacillus marinus]SEN58932.1 flagellar FliJ protein [Amphibacillus marinus]
MTNVRAFNKILNHQQHLKNQAQMAYQTAVDEFQEVAEKLYLLLQKKEQVEKEYNYYLSSSGTVTTIATHYAFIERIKEKIALVQVELQKKRTMMEHRQQNLTAAHVEVKKIEKIIEKKKLKLVELERYHDMQAMDEVGSRLYFKHGDR